jgi:hypothetical protein
MGNRSNKIIHGQICEIKQLPTRENSDIRAILEDLNTYGYTIIRGLEKNIAEVDEIYNQIAKDITHFLLGTTDMTVKELKATELPHVNGGILSAYERFYHTRGQWMIRSNPIICEIMANIHKCREKDLICSFDTMGIRWAPEVFYTKTRQDEVFRCKTRQDDPLSKDTKVLAHEIDLNKENENKIDEKELKAHIDQALSDTTFRYYQGLYNINDSSEEEDGGLYVYSGSHKIHGPKLATEFNLNIDAPFLFYPPEVFEKYSDIKQIKLNIKAGNIVLWDSRTAHGSKPISSLRNKYIVNDTDKVCDILKYNRLVQYMCYSVRGKSNEEQLCNRKEAYMNGYGTNHVANDPRIIEIVSYTDLEDDEYLNEYHKSLI